MVDFLNIYNWRCNSLYPLGTGTPAFNDKERRCVATSLNDHVYWFAAEVLFTAIIIIAVIKPFSIQKYIKMKQ